MLRKHQPDKLFVFYADKVDPEVWNDMFPDDDMENVVMDHHHYQFENPGIRSV